MIQNIENLDYDDLLPIINQVIDEIVRRNKSDTVLEVKEIVDYQEYPDAFILDIGTFNDESFTITFTKEQIVELRTRFNKTNY